MTLRDRTNEFFAVAESEARKRKHRGTAPAASSGNSSDGQNSVTEPLLAAAGGSSSRFEALDEMRSRQPAPGTSTFPQEAGQIGKEIASVSSKLERLTKCAFVFAIIVARFAGPFAPPISFFVVVRS